MAQSTSSGTSSRRHVRDHDTASIASSRYADTEWEAKEVGVLFQKSYIFL